MTSDSAKWCPVHNTTHTINGLRLVSPEDYHCLTYDSEGREVLECAGKVEEQ